MLTTLISNSSFSADEWQNLISKSCNEIAFKARNEIVLKKDQTFTLESKDSLCGLEFLLQSNGLKLFLNSLPSRKDFRLLCKILEMASKSSSSFRDQDLVKKLLKSDSFNSSFDEIWMKEINGEEILIERDKRKMNLKLWLDDKLSPSDQESLLFKKVQKVTEASAPEIFPIDGKESAIWDGSEMWLSSKIDQVLFSQSYFKGKICGEISAKQLVEVISDKIIYTGYGYILPEARKLNGDDIKSLNEVLNHYEVKEQKSKLEKLTIEVGKLEEISYSMSRALFEGVKLSKITDQYLKDGISKTQLEVAALAVSSMLEIAAVSKGSSLDAMKNKLKEKCKLSAEAAYAVASGFVNAAKEAKPQKSKLRWLAWLILIFPVAVLLWYFFFT